MTQVAFAVEHVEPMRTWAIQAADPETGPPRIVAVADDTYIVGDADKIADHWPGLEEELEPGLLPLAPFGRNGGRP